MHQSQWVSSSSYFTDHFYVTAIAGLSQHEVSDYGEISKLMSLGNAHRYNINGHNVTQYEKKDCCSMKKVQFPLTTQEI